MAQNLFKKEGNTHDLYRYLKNDPQGTEIREEIEGWWKVLKPYGDKGFEKRFAQTDKFLPCLWELYLAISLKKNGCLLLERKGNPPDVGINVGEQDIWFEATVSKTGTGADRLECSSKGRAAPEKPIMLRFTHSITTKSKNFKKTQQKTIPSDSPFIIAINAYNLEKVCFPFDLTLYLAKCLFSIGDMFVTWSPSTEDVTGPYFDQRKSITKHNDANVPTEFFMNDQHSHVSAVLFSRQLTQWPPQYGNEFVIFHNPLAKNPIPFGTFPFCAECRWDDTNSSLECTKQVEEIFTHLA